LIVSQAEDTTDFCSNVAIFKSEDFEKLDREKNETSDRVEVCPENCCVAEDATDFCSNVAIFKDVTDFCNNVAIFKDVTDFCSNVAIFKDNTSVHNRP